MHAVHAKKIACKDGGLVPAGTGADFNDAAVEVFFAGQEQIFELVDQFVLHGPEGSKFLAGQLQEVGIIAQQHQLSFSNGFLHSQKLQIGDHAFG